jgi:hypothetical protein
MRPRLSKKTLKKRLLQLLEYTKLMTVVYGLHYIENESDRPNQPQAIPRGHNKVLLELQVAATENAVKVIRLQGLLPL